MAEYAVPTNRDSVSLLGLNFTRTTATPGQPHLLMSVAQNLAAIIPKAFRNEAKKIDNEDADMDIIKVEEYVNHRYYSLGRSCMRFISTYIDSDTRSISSRGTVTYRMYFSNFDFAFYIEKKDSFLPRPNIRHKDDGSGPGPPLVLPGNGVLCQFKTFETADGNVYYASQVGSGVWPYRHPSNLSVHQHIAQEEEAVEDRVAMT